MPALLLLLVMTRPIWQTFLSKANTRVKCVTELNLLIIQLTKCSFLVRFRWIDRQYLMQSHSQHTSREEAENLTALQLFNSPAPPPVDAFYPHYSFPGMLLSRSFLLFYFSAGKILISSSCSNSSSHPAVCRLHLFPSVSLSYLRLDRGFFCVFGAGW